VLVHAAGVWLTCKHVHVQTKHWISHSVDPDMGMVLDTPFGASLLMSRVEEITATAASRARAMEVASKRRAAAKHAMHKSSAAFFMTTEELEAIDAVAGERVTMETIRRQRKNIVDVELSLVTKSGRQALPSFGNHVMAVGSIVRVKSSGDGLHVGVEGAVLELYVAALVLFRRLVAVTHVSVPSFFGGLSLRPASTFEQPPWSSH